MSAENAKEMVELLGDITQVGIVIEDMEKAKAGMLKVFGLKPDAESDNLYKKTWYRGEIIDAPVKAAFYNQLNVQLEFLQPVVPKVVVMKNAIHIGLRMPPRRPKALATPAPRIRQAVGKGSDR